MRILLLGLLVGCGLWAELKSDIEFVRRGETPLTLDAWVPDGPGPFPAVIIVHGGGFVRGDKQTYVKPLFPVLSDAGLFGSRSTSGSRPATASPTPYTTSRTPCDG